jgi:hypothetical protein
MTVVFVGGSRRVSRLAPQVRERLDRIIQKGLPVLIGDANGADKAVQHYLHSRGYQNVEVFCAGDACRNNLGNWKRRHVWPNSAEKRFEFYSAKDRLMSRGATVGLMIWDGKSVGTLLNVLRLLKAKKKAVVYDAPQRKFWELRSQLEWQSFSSRCDPELRQKVEHKAALEERADAVGQASFLT